MSLSADDLRFPSPFYLKKSTEGWHGETKTIDGTSTDLFDESDVAEILYSYSSEKEGADDYDGDCGAVIRLKDGRLAAWESWWGPTGDGFSEDAYGGDTTIWFAHSENLNKLLLQAFSDEMRRYFSIPAEGL